VIHQAQAKYPLKSIKKVPRFISPPKNLPQIFYCFIAAEPTNPKATNWNQK